MGAITIVMFAGITLLALQTQVRFADDPAQLIGAPADYVQRTAIAQVAGATFGYSSVWFLLVQGFTAAVLVLAANTAFNGFPILASILGQDGYLPRQSAGVATGWSSATGSSSWLRWPGLIWIFDASTSRLIQLYILGVFVSFTLSQAGMVRHWTRLLRAAGGCRPGGRLRRARLINGDGAVLTVHAVPSMCRLMWPSTALPPGYRRAGGPALSLPSRVHAVVLVSACSHRQRPHRAEPAILGRHTSWRRNGRSVASPSR